MASNNYLFWASLVLGAGALIWLMAAKAFGSPPEDAVHPVEDLPSDPE